MSLSELISELEEPKLSKDSFVGIKSEFKDNAKTVVLESNYIFTQKDELDPNYNGVMKNDPLKEEINEINEKEIESKTSKFDSLREQRIEDSTVTYELDEAKDENCNYNISMQEISGINLVYYINK